MVLLSFVVLFSIHFYQSRLIITCSVFGRKNGTLMAWQVYGFHRHILTDLWTWQHCYVTGGSQGLGLSVAKLLARQGANVSIVARDQTKLDKALEEIEVCSRVTWFDRTELSFIFRQKDARQTRSSMPIRLHSILPRLRQKRLKLFADHIMAKHRTRHLLVQGLHGQDFL